MNNVKNEKSFSAMEQIKCISVKNTLVNADKKDLKADSFNDIMELINKLDDRVINNHHIYESILVSWKIKNSINI